MNRRKGSYDSPAKAMRKTREQLYDELLVLRSLEGDRQALGELVTRWHPRLRRHAYCLIGNREAAEDVVQETWLAIVKGLSRLDAAEAFAGWAYRIVGNKCVDWVRRQDSQRRLSADLPLDAHAQSPIMHGRSGRRPA